MKIIGITGTFWAGKGTIVEYLKTKGFTHYSVSDFLKKIILKRWLPVNRDTMNKISDDLRKEYWPWYLVEQLYIFAEEKGKDCIIESIRTLWEIESLKRTGNFSLWAIDADQKLRYKRIQLRKSEKDNVSFEKFQEQELSELWNTEPYKKNITWCIKKADILIQNNWSLESLHQQIDSILK